METHRRLAVVAGVLFIVATVADLISRAVLVQPILGAPGYLDRVSANEGQVLLGALFLAIGAIAAAGIAMALYPVLREQSEGLALGSVGFRLIEGALYLGIVACLLALVALVREAKGAEGAGASAYEVPAALLMAARDALGEVAVVAFGTGALMYYWVFYRTRMLPRWLSAWGVLAIVLLLASSVLVMLGLAEPMSTVQIVLAFPIFLQEMALAVWLIAKGFGPSAVRARDLPARQPAASALDAHTPAAA